MHTRTRHIKTQYQFLSSLDMSAREGDLFFEGKEASKDFPDVLSIQTECQLILLRILTAQRYMCVRPRSVFVYEYLCAGQECMAP